MIVAFLILAAVIAAGAILAGATTTGALRHRLEAFGEPLSTGRS